MVLYKQVILTNLKSSPAETATAFKELATFVLSKGGVVRDVSHRGHRTLGYAIDDRRWGGTFQRHREAKLVVKTLETSPATLKELEAKMKLSYPILRFSTFKVKKDPLRDVIKASASASVAEPVTPFNWKEFKASTDENTKVFEEDYVFEGTEVAEDQRVQSEFDLMSQEDKDDLADWLESKTRPELAAKEDAAKKDEFNLYGSVDANVDEDEEDDDEEEDDDDDDDIAEWEEGEFEPTQDVPEWKRDSSYEPERPSKKGKDN